MAEAITGKPTPSLAAKRKRRREETGRAFEMVRALTGHVTRALVRFMYSPSRYDPKAEREYAEHVLQTQMEEWSHEGEQQQDESFHYASAAGFDPHP